MKDKLEGGDTLKKRIQEERTIEQYVKNKELNDMLLEQHKKKQLKNAELDAKRILDIQMAERE